MLRWFGYCTSSSRYPLLIEPSIQPPCLWNLMTSMKQGQAGQQIAGLKVAFWLLKMQAHVRAI